MFILLLHYTVPLETVDQHIEQHVRYLTKHYKLGHFIASGRKVPRTGGVIVIGNMEKEKAEEIIREDPFYVHKVAQFELVEFNPTLVCKELKGWVE